MSDLDELDRQLRALAHAALDEAAADAQDVVAEDRTALGLASITSGGPTGRSVRSWLAVAAAGVVVVGGVAVFIRGTDDGPSIEITDPTAVQTTISTSTSEMVPAISTGTTVPSSDATMPASKVRATVQPATALPGGTLTITPDGEINPYCLGLADIAPVVDGRVGEPIGQILSDGTWVRATDKVPLTYPLCLPPATSGAVTLALPTDLALGDYVVCIGGGAAGCGLVAVDGASEPTCWTEPLAPPALVDGRAAGEPQVEAGAGGRSVATWGGGSFAAVRQSFGIEPDPRAFAAAMTEPVVNGSWEAAIVQVFEPAPGRTDLVFRNLADGCQRAYSLDSGYTFLEVQTFAGQWLAALVDGTPVPDVRHADAPSPVPYVASRSVDDRDRESVGVAVHDIGRDGTDLGERPDSEVREEFEFPVDLGDGRRIGLVPWGDLSGRCVNREIISIGSGPLVDAAKAIGAARSIAGNESGMVVVGRDVCPEGTRWGDDGTQFELVAYDLADSGSTPVLLDRRNADPDQILFDDGVSTVSAFGELMADSVSPDGHFVGVRESTQIESHRWRVYSARGGDAALELSPSCDDHGDLVGRPDFVGDGLVVVARECSPVTGEIGQLVVEAVSLDDLEVAWSRAVDIVQINSYTGALDDLSATVVDGEVWVLLSGSADSPAPPRAALVHGDDEVEITRPAFWRFAFELADLA